MEFSMEMWKREPKHPPIDHTLFVRYGVPPVMLKWTYVFINRDWHIERALQYNHKSVEIDQSNTPPYTMFRTI